MYHNFFIHASDGHLRCFHFLAIVNSASMNNGIHVSLSILVSSGLMPRSGIARSYDGFIPSFLRDLHTDFHSKGDQSWVFFGRNDAEAETPVLWPPHAKS